jgi:hypothetical protein
MRRPASVRALEDFGRVRLSRSFFMRDFLYSEISQIELIPNVPDYPDTAIEAGSCLCEHVLEPLQRAFGRISIRSGYRSPAVNQRGNEKRYNCAKNESNYAQHIWDHRDAGGHLGASACIVVNSFTPYYERTGHWQALAWWIHENVPAYSAMEFFPKLAAFNIGWHQNPRKRIDSHIEPKGCLTKPGMANHSENHKHEYEEFLRTLRK